MVYDGLATLGVHALLNIISVLRKIVRGINVVYVLTPLSLLEKSAAICHSFQYVYIMHPQSGLQLVVLQVHQTMFRLFSSNSLSSFINVSNSIIPIFERFHINLYFILFKYFDYILFSLYIRQKFKNVLDSSKHFTNFKKPSILV